MQSRKIPATIFSSTFLPCVKSLNLSRAFIAKFEIDWELVGTWKPPMSHLSVNKETRIIRDPAMVITAHNTERIVTIMVHIFTFRFSEIKTKLTRIVLKREEYTFTLRITTHYIGQFNCQNSCKKFHNNILWNNSKRSLSYFCLLFLQLHFWTCSLLAALTLLASSRQQKESISIECRLYQIMMTYDKEKTVYVGENIKLVDRYIGLHKNFRPKCRFWF